MSDRDKPPPPATAKLNVVEPSDERTPTDGIVTQSYVRRKFAEVVDVAKEKAVEAQAEASRAEHEEAAQRRREKLPFRITLGTGAAAFVATVIFNLWQLAHGANAKSTATAETVEQRTTKLESHVKDIRQEQTETRQDIRELYRAVVDRRRSRQLERPAPSPDGGESP